MTKETKPAEKPEPKGKGDPHDRIDALVEVMRANGWTVKG